MSVINGYISVHEREKRRSNLLTSCILAIPALQWLIERNGSQVNTAQVYQVNRIAGRSCRYSPGMFVHLCEGIKVLLFAPSDRTVHSELD